ncbi:unnamed protein product, partial [Urochloa humidicola]
SCASGPSLTRERSDSASQRRRLRRRRPSSRSRTRNQTGEIKDAFAPFDLRLHRRHKPIVCQGPEATCVRSEGRIRTAPPSRFPRRLTSRGAMVKYVRSHERYTWRGVLHTHADPKKRKGFKILSHPRDRAKDNTLHVRGSCVWYSFATALEAAFRVCGVDVGKLSWEDLHDMVDQ